jgi:signal transduction histidine kinase
VPCDLPLFANEAALERLFLSILDNAIKYTPTGGHVALRLHLEEAQAIIEVADTGIGIAEKDLPHVFERFYRADQVRSRETRGSGLGLSIAKWIAESHNGSIELQSRPGQGTKVIIRLPLVKEPTNSDTHPQELKEISAHIVYPLPKLKVHSHPVEQPRG